MLKRQNSILLQVCVISPCYVSCCTPCTYVTKGNPWGCTTDSASRRLRAAFGGKDSAANHSVSAGGYATNITKAKDCYRPSWIPITAPTFGQIQEPKRGSHIGTQWLTAISRR